MAETYEEIMQKAVEALMCMQNQELISESEAKSLQEEIERTTYIFINLKIMFFQKTFPSYFLLHPLLQIVVNQ